MSNYCVNAVSGDHEVHDLASTEGCLPDADDWIELGWHSDCHSAMRTAHHYYSNAVGCPRCAPDCHTT